MPPDEGGGMEINMEMYESQPLISVIMPVYNCELFLAEAIESVLDQSYMNWELLIVNDGSIDQTYDIVNSYAQKDLRIRVFHKKNEGVSKARNFALNQSRGEYVTFIDGDDVYHAERLKRMQEVFEENTNCDIVFATHKEFTGKLNIKELRGTKKVTVCNNNILKKVLSDSSIQFMCNVMLKSEIAKMEQFASFRFAEDFCYIRDCAWHCKQMAVLDEMLYFYRRDNENAMTNHFLSEKYVMDYMRLVENMYEFCEKHNLKDDFYKMIVSHEYAQNSMRIRKCTSYSKFVTCMNDKKFREGIRFADASKCTLFEKFLFYMVKYKIYLPFAFWIW